MRLNRSTKLLSTIVLVSALSFITDEVPLVQPAAASPALQSLMSANRHNESPESWQDEFSKRPERDRNDDLSRQFSMRIRQDLAQRTGIPAQAFRIIEAQRRTWNNLCLELPEPGELCGQSLVEGWRVVVARNRQTWVYRTDAEGRILRLETATQANTLPDFVAKIVFRDIGRRSKTPRDSLKIVRAEPQTWKNGCLELAEPDVFCTQVLVPGWRVSVESPTQQWIYRTDRDGSVVRLERESSLNESRSLR